MSFDPTNPNPYKPKFGFPRPASVPNILKQQFNDGRVRVYGDVKHEAEKVEIRLDNATINIYKELSHSIGKLICKKMEIYSMDNELRETIDIFSENIQTVHVSYRFYLRQMQIGRGSGDVDLYIAHKLLSQDIPSIPVDATLDPEVIETIQKIIAGKTI